MEYKMKYNTISNALIAGLAAMVGYFGALSWKQSQIIETLQPSKEVRILEKYDLNKNEVIELDELTNIINDYDLEIK